MDSIALCAVIASVAYGTASPFSPEFELKQALSLSRFDSKPSNILFFLIDAVKLGIAYVLTPPEGYTLFAPSEAAFIRTARDLGLVGRHSTDFATITALPKAISATGDLKCTLKTILK